MSLVPGSSLDLRKARCVTFQTRRGRITEHFHDAGVESESYRYYKAETRGLDFDGLKEDLGSEGRGRGAFTRVRAQSNRRRSDRR